MTHLRHRRPIFVVMHDAVSFAARRLLEGNHENPIYRSGINAGGGSTWWRCCPSSACASQTARLLIAINEVSDPNGYAKEYVPPAQKSVKDHGGEYVAAGPATQVAGNLPNGPVVIIRWESMDALQGWRNSPEARRLTG